MSNTAAKNKSIEELCETLGGNMPRGKVGNFVFQRTKPESANCTEHGDPRLQIRRHVIPFDPMTPAQLAQRRKLTNAAFEWHNLSDTARQREYAKANGNKSKAYANFCARKLKS